MYFPFRQCAYGRYYRFITSYIILTPKRVIVNILYIKNIYALVQTRQKDICKIVGKFVRQLYDKNSEFGRGKFGIRN